MAEEEKSAKSQSAFFFFFFRESPMCLPKSCSLHFSLLADAAFAQAYFVWRTNAFFSRRPIFSFLFRAQKEKKTLSLPDIKHKKSFIPPPSE